MLEHAEADTLFFLCLCLAVEDEGLQEAETVPGVQEVFSVNRNIDRSDCVF